MNFFEIGRPDLWDFKCPEANERAELDNQIVALAVCCPAKVVDLAGLQRTAGLLSVVACKT